MQTIEKYGLFELTLQAQQPAMLTVPCAVFSMGSLRFSVSAFYDGEGKYLVRFMPCEPGVWCYTIQWEGKETQGEFTCVDVGASRHGPVQAEGYDFRHADGYRYLPFGTTCYAWTHQPEALQVQTLESLKTAPFNKLRMCVFPKHMPYNHNEPELFPFHKNKEGKWDVYRPNKPYWDHLDVCLDQLATLGIEADLILFHPYDCWGFSSLSHEDSLAYVTYCVARLAAHANVWWSLANEYDFIFSKTIEEWCEIGALVAMLDPYKHMLSIHNCFALFPKQDWMTHVSVQTVELEKLPLWRKEFEIPIVVDECGYEGDIEFNWGNISAFEMVHRFWQVLSRGGYCTHGETFYREDEVLWWAKGGLLYGKSAERIGFLRTLLESVPNAMVPQARKELAANPNAAADGGGNGYFRAFFALPEADRALRMLTMTPPIISNDDTRLHYLGRACPVLLDVKLPEAGKYRVEAIDCWEMTRSILEECAGGTTRVWLPGKEGMAVLVTRLEGEAL